MYPWKNGTIYFCFIEQYLQKEKKSFIFILENILCVAAWVWPMEQWNNRTIEQ
jgi:hypothetical protein